MAKDVRWAKQVALIFFFDSSVLRQIHELSEVCQDEEHLHVKYDDASSRRSTWKQASASYVSYPLTGTKRHIALLYTDPREVLPASSQHVHYVR